MIEIPDIIDFLEKKIKENQELSANSLFCVDGKYYSLKDFLGRAQRLEGDELLLFLRRAVFSIMNTGIECLLAKSKEYNIVM